MKRFLAITLVLVTLLTIVTPISAVSATSVQLAGITSVPVGGTVTWSASVQPQNADNKAITWKSWYPAVATVDAHGNITGHRVGQAHISAIAANGVKSTCTIHVSEPHSYDSHDYGYEPEYQESYSYTVYITRTGAKYHSGGCRYLRKSKIAISLSNAKAYGYTACSVCRP